MTNPLKSTWVDIVLARTDAKLDETLSQHSGQHRLLR